MTADWGAIEAKWRGRWAAERRHEADPGPGKKMFITVAYPYPNSPQHLGHGRTYTVADVHARYCRMRGYNVLFPMGFHYTGTPILGMARRIEAGDEEVVSGLRDVFGVPEADIATLTGPERIADYFRREIREGMVEMGYSIDWRREFATTDPGYRRFVEWQVGSLRDKGLIVQGSHPVGWCPDDGNPVSQHDTAGDVEPSFTEYALVAFRAGGRVLPAATLRPETVFGATNLWANPGAEYVRARVDGEEWVVSEECARKLGFLGRDVVIEGRVPGSELVGTEAEGPQGGRVPVLAAGFADPAKGTGIVMSVPAHAPADWRALEDLGGAGIEPAKIIDTEGYGECPAREACERLGIRDQGDPRLEEATSEVYGKEFYGGVLNSGCGRFAGMPVREARDAVREWLGAGALLELDNAPVRCRCGAECVVKMLDNQWFLDYGDAGWKERAGRCLASMSVLPPEISGEFGRVLGWLRERACARQRGLGTRLPWDLGWIVESLSDSVVYMAYYVIARFVNDGTVAPDELTREALDYVFLGKEYAGATGAARLMRAEFEYFYPVDSRHSGRDLVPNHLTFFVLNHVALFGEADWPRQIVVNGSVLMGGKKMSKSMGNIVPLRGAIAEHGADPVRLAMVLSAELLQDADVDVASVPGIARKLEAMLGACGAPAPAPGPAHAEDRWLLARLGRLVEAATASVERMRLREALHEVLFGFESDLQWHGRRAAARGGGGGAVLRRVQEARALLLAPFAPHAADEMWERMGMPGTATGSAWPEPPGRDAAALRDEGLVRGVMDDISNILRATGLEPRRITVYAAGAEKSAAYGRILGLVASGSADMREVMRGLLGGEGAGWAKKNPEFVQRALRDVLSETAESRAARSEAGGADEEAVLRAELAPLARAELGAEVAVYSEDDPAAPDPAGKARHARPYKPAILVE